MRVISGTWRGQPLKVAKGIRATTDRVKEAIFSIMGDVRGLEILDVYAGSGSLGIEALSRGAKSACFVDRSRRALGCIESNLAGKGAEGVKLIYQDSIKFLHSTPLTFDWIFCDPPYEAVKLSELIDTFASSRALGSKTLLVLETDRYHTFTVPAELAVIDRRKFGDTVVYIIGRSASHRQEISRA
jgi:16S rRNA (guanine(966)-N(2))-methyltransferase RsmD